MQIKSIMSCELRFLVFYKNVYSFDLRLYINFTDYVTMVIKQLPYVSKVYGNFKVELR